MIVYNLRCKNGHEFEGWFRDSATYDAQAVDGKLFCPTCNSRRVEKAIMAPALAGERDPAAAAAAWVQIEPALGVLEVTLATRSWLAGDFFTVADLNVAAAMYRCLFMDLATWPHVKDWLSRCWDRPAAMKARAMRE